MTASPVPGDRISWMAINGRRYGTVLINDDTGILVQVDGGGKVIISTERSIQAAAAWRRMKIETNF